jgi:hypothetical protein
VGFVVSVYRYQQGSVIDEVTFVKSDGGSLRAYLHATPDTPEKTLNDISMTMAKRGWQIVPNSMNGMPTLEIRGFGRKAQINDILSENGWAKGKAEITADKKNKDDSRLWDKFRKRSLFLSGIAFMISDACYTIYGKEDKTPLNAAAGLAYMAGGVASSVFARRDTPDLQIKDIAGRMANYMQAQNIELPDDCALNSIVKDKHKGLIKTTDDFFRRYPAELSNTLIGLAGALIATDAIKNRVLGEASKVAITEMLKKEGSNYRKIAPNLSEDAYTAMAEKAVKKHMRFTGLSDASLGAVTMGSGAFGTFVQEKSHDPDMPKKHGLPGIWEWIQERPLLVTGIGYLVSSGFHLASALKDRKDGDSAKRDAVKWRMGFIGWTALGEVLIAISSKGHGKGVVSDKSVGDSAISLAADLIAKQPPAKQEYLIDYMSSFLGREDVLARRDIDVKDLLRTLVELVKKNPWARCKEVLPPKPAVTNELFVSPPENKWQTVVAKSMPQNSPAASL